MQLSAARCKRGFGSSSKNAFAKLINSQNTWKTTTFPQLDNLRSLEKLGKSAIGRRNYGSFGHSRTLPTLVQALNCARLGLATSTSTTRLQDPHPGMGLPHHVEKLVDAGHSEEAAYLLLCFAKTAFQHPSETTSQNFHKGLLEVRSSLEKRMSLEDRTDGTNILEQSNLLLEKNQTEQVLYMLLCSACSAFEHPNETRSKNIQEELWQVFSLLQKRAKERKSGDQDNDRQPQPIGNDSDKANVCSQINEDHVGGLPTHVEQLVERGHAAEAVRLVLCLMGESFVAPQDESSLWLQQQLKSVAPALASMPPSAGIQPEQQQQLVQQQLRQTQLELDNTKDNLDLLAQLVLFAGFMWVMFNISSACKWSSWADEIDSKVDRRVSYVRDLKREVEEVRELERKVWELQRKVWELERKGQDSWFARLLM